MMMMYTDDDTCTLINNDICDRDAQLRSIVKGGCGCNKTFISYFIIFS